MPYLQSIDSYLLQSSLLREAYPDTTRITTKYSLPRKSTSEADRPANPPADHDGKREPQPPAASLTLKTFEPSTGICLKYQTNKAAEVGRLMTGLGRLVRGENVASTEPEKAEQAEEPKAEAKKKKKKGKK